MYEKIPIINQNKAFIYFLYIVYKQYKYSCEFKSRSWRDVLDTTLCDKVCQ